MIAVWRLSHLPHEQEFLLDTGPREHGPATRHLEEDTAHTPTVDEDTQHSQPLTSYNSTQSLASYPGHFHMVWV